MRCLLGVTFERRVWTLDAPPTGRMLNIAPVPALLNRVFHRETGLRSSPCLVVGAMQAHITRAVGPDYSPAPRCFCVLKSSCRPPPVPVRSTWCLLPRIPGGVMATFFGGATASLCEGGGLSRRTAGARSEPAGLTCARPSRALGARYPASTRAPWRCCRSRARPWTLSGEFVSLLVWPVSSSFTSRNFVEVAGLPAAMVLTARERDASVILLTSRRNYSAASSCRMQGVYAPRRRHNVSIYHFSEASCCHLPQFLSVWLPPELSSLGKAHRVQSYVYPSPLPFVGFSSRTYPLNVLPPFSTLPGPDLTSPRGRRNGLRTCSLA